MVVGKTGELALVDQPLQGYLRAVVQGETRSFAEWQRAGAQLCLPLEPADEPAIPLIPAAPVAGERFTGLSALLADLTPWLFEADQLPAAWGQVGSLAPSAARDSI